MTDTLSPEPAKKQPRLIPATQWNEHHQWPPLGGLRHLIFNAESNGFKKVIKRCGRRVLIDEAAFFQWMEEQNA
jgi:hypothetical protein